MYSEQANPVKHSSEVKSMNRLHVTDHVTDDRIMMPSLVVLDLTSMTADASQYHILYSFTTKTVL